MSALESPDTLEGEVTVSIVASLAATEENDSLASSLEVVIQAIFEGVEEDDTLIADTYSPAYATLNVTEQGDTVRSFVRTSIVNIISGPSPVHQTITGRSRYILD
jgi:hypothetical protein